MLPEGNIHITYKKQLGNLYNIVDDCIWYICEYLENPDFNNLYKSSRYFFFGKILNKRLKLFKDNRKKKIEITYLKRDPEYQFANLIFRIGKCVISDCNIRRGRLRLTNITSEQNRNTFFSVPYCAYHWNNKILPMYT